jgi:hypothetical protein
MTFGSTGQVRPSAADKQTVQSCRTGIYTPPFQRCPSTPLLSRERNDFYFSFRQAALAERHHFACGNTSLRRHVFARANPGIIT